MSARSPLESDRMCWDCRGRSGQMDVHEDGELRRLLFCFVFLEPPAP